MIELLDWEAEGGRILIPKVRMADCPTTVVNRLKDKDGVAKGISTKKGLSLAEIRASENKHNRKVKKSERNLIGPLIVYGGMNTVGRQNNKRDYR